MRELFAWENPLSSRNWVTGIIAFFFVLVATFVAAMSLTRLLMEFTR